MNSEYFKKLKALIVDRKLDLVKQEVAANPGVVHAHSPLDGWTLLHVAADAGYVEGIEYLHSMGADVNARNAEHRRPLHFAVLSKNEGAITKLLELRADPHLKDYNDLSPLQFAIQRPVPPGREARRLTNIRTLLSHRADADVPDYDNDDALHSAAKTGFIGALDLFLAEKADLEHRNGIGATLLHSAVNGKKRDMIDYLLGKGADINCADYRGSTPLHYAVQTVGPDRVEFVGFVLSRGADPDISNRENLRAEDLPVDGDILQVFAAFRARRAVQSAISARLPAANRTVD